MRRPPRRAHATRCALHSGWLVRRSYERVGRGDRLGNLLHLLLKFLESLPLSLLKLGRFFVEATPVRLHLSNHLVQVLFFLKQLLLLLFEQLFKVAALLLHLLQLLLMMKLIVVGLPSLKLY